MKPSEFRCELKEALILTLIQPYDEGDQDSQSRNDISAVGRTRTVPYITKKIQC